MIKNLLGIKEKKRIAPPIPRKERASKTVPTKRFNDMIDYYTNELRSRLKEIEQLREENQLLLKTSIKNAARSDENRLRADKLQEDLRKSQKR